MVAKGSRPGAAALRYVFADIHMPVIDGITMTKDIRAAEEKEGLVRTAIVAVTADVMPGCEERCRAAGMDDFVSKPVDLDNLRRVLKRWLPDAPVAAPAIDTKVLDRWMEPDDGERLDILRRFNETVTASSHDMEKALARDDLATLQSAAHRLRSGALAVGATTLGNSAEALERAAKFRDRPACEVQWGQLIAEMDRVRAQIAA